MDFEFKTIDHNNLGEVVYQHIADALIKGALKPGERLKICDLAQEMGTSVTPVRDAILRLVHEGALLLKSLRDIRVPILHQDRYLEIRMIRLELEGLAAERAASNAQTADIERLERLVVDNEKALAANEFARATEINQVFHFELANIAAMPILRGILQNLWLQMGPVIAAAYEGGGRTMIEHHYDVMEAIRRRDPVAAKNTIRNDILSGGGVILGTRFARRPVVGTSTLQTHKGIRRVMAFSPSSRVNIERLWSTIEHSGGIGRGREGGLSRLALSDADKAIRDVFVQWCREAGLAVTIDKAGNIFARRPGIEDGLPPVLMGSHLDTQANGGRFDGILGVLGALEVVRTLNDLGHKTRRPIEIVNWTNEEGARFSPPMTASGCFAGAYDLDWVHQRPSDDGMTFGDELRRIGYLGDAPVGGRALDSDFELHIEQGPILDAEKVQVGVVTHAYSSRGFIAEFKGETAHTGPWPMERRRNALVAAARLLVAVDDLGWDHAAGAARRLRRGWSRGPTRPVSCRTGRRPSATCATTIRPVADVMAERVERAVGEAAARAGCKGEVLERWDWGGAIFDQGMITGIVVMQALSGTRPVTCRARPATMPISWPDLPHRHDFHPAPGRHHAQQQRVRKPGRSGARLERIAPQRDRAGRSGSRGRRHGAPGRRHRVARRGGPSPDGQAILAGLCDLLSAARRGRIGAQIKCARSLRKNDASCIMLFDGMRPKESTMTTSNSSDLASLLDTASPVLSVSQIETVAHEVFGLAARPRN